MHTISAPASATVSETLAVRDPAATARHEGLNAHGSAAGAYGPAKRVLLLGGCQMHSLRGELHDVFDCVQRWRRPTIALMSPPVSSVAVLGFANRQARYIRHDCDRTHLEELRADPCDVLIFEIVRDVRCPLVRGGEAYIFDPNRMYGLINDALPPAESAIDVAALIGAPSVEPFTASDPRFFEVWRNHFDRFYETVLRPRIASGCVVIVVEIFLAKQTVPPSDALQAQWEYCDFANALLRRMYAHVATFAGLGRISMDEAHCLTSIDAPWGGPSVAHPTGDVFACLADQARALIAPDPTSAARSTFRRLSERTGQLHAERAVWDAERAGWEAERDAWRTDRAARDAERVAFDAERIGWDAERDVFRTDRAAWDAERVAWGAERIGWEKEREAWNTDRAAWDEQRHRMTQENRALGESLANRIAALETFQRAERRRLHRRIWRFSRNVMNACRAARCRFRPSRTPVTLPSASAS